MNPLELPENTEHQYVIGNQQYGYILYNNTDLPVIIEKAKVAGSQGIYFIDPETGHLIEYRMDIADDELISIPNPNNGPVVIWIKSHHSIMSPK